MPLLLCSLLLTRISDLVVVVNESISASFSHTFTGLKPSELYQGYVIGESFGVMGPTTNISFSTGL